MEKEGAAYAVVSDELTKECFIEEYYDIKLHSKKWAEKEKHNKNLRLEANFATMQEAEHYIQISFRFHNRGWKYNKSRNSTTESKKTNPKQCLINRGLFENEAEEFLSRRTITLPERDLQIKSIYDTPEEMTEQWFNNYFENNSSTIQCIKENLDMKGLAESIIEKENDYYMQLESGRIIQFPYIETKHTCNACDNDYCYAMGRPLTDEEAELCKYYCVLDAKDN
mgnify:CR=1 FL=1